MYLRSVCDYYTCYGCICHACPCVPTPKKKPGPTVFEYKYIIIVLILDVLGGQHGSPAKLALFGNTQAFSCFTGFELESRRTWLKLEDKDGFSFVGELFWKHIQMSSRPHSEVEISKTWANTYFGNFSWKRRPRLTAKRAQKPAQSRKRPQLQKRRWIAVQTGNLKCFDISEKDSTVFTIHLTIRKIALLAAHGIESFIISYYISLSSSSLSLSNGYPEGIWCRSGPGHGHFFMKPPICILSGHKIKLRAFQGPSETKTNHID